MSPYRLAHLGANMLQKPYHMCDAGGHHVAVRVHYVVSVVLLLQIGAQ